MLLLYEPKRSVFAAGWRCVASCGLPRVVICSDGGRAALSLALELDIQPADFFVRGCMHGSNATPSTRSGAAAMAWRRWEREGGLGR